MLFVIYIEQCYSAIIVVEKNGHGERRPRLRQSNQLEWWTISQLIIAAS